MKELEKEVTVLEMLITQYESKLLFKNKSFNNVITQLELISKTLREYNRKQFALGNLCVTMAFSNSSYITYEILKITTDFTKYFKVNSHEIVPRISAIISSVEATTI